MLTKTATASEVLTQRKLADAEAVLRRTKEEAERVINEAQRAKADAQAARESGLRQSATSPMRKQLERPPKGDAKATSKANQDLARDCESGLGLQDTN